jgi:hypothetical protein
MSTLIIRDLPESRTLDAKAMLALRGGTSFASHFTPSEPIRTFIPGDPIRPITSNIGIYSSSPTSL